MRHLRACGLFPGGLRFCDRAAVFERTAGFTEREGDSAMGSTVSGLADAVFGVVQGVGLSSDTVARYGKCCEAVVEFCGRRGLDALSGSVVEEFAACQQERARRGEIGANRRNALVKSARLMLEFQATGAVAWRMMSPDPDLALSESSRAVLKQFAAVAGQEVAPGSVRLLAGEIRQFLAYLDQAGMPLALLTEWLGHADPETTLIYAHADTEMKRQALEKANSATSQSPLPAPLWHDREDIIQRLCGLKE